MLPAESAKQLKSLHQSKSHSLDITALHKYSIPDNTRCILELSLLKFGGSDNALRASESYS